MKGTVTFRLDGTAFQGRWGLKVTVPFMKMLKKSDFSSKLRGSPRGKGR